MTAVRNFPEGSLFRLGSRSVISAWVGEVGAVLPARGVAGSGPPPRGSHHVRSPRGLLARVASLPFSTVGWPA